MNVISSLGINSRYGTMFDGNGVDPWRPISNPRTPEPPWRAGGPRPLGGRVVACTPGDLLIAVDLLIEGDNKQPARPQHKTLVKSSVKDLSMSW